MGELESGDCAVLGDPVREEEDGPVLVFLPEEAS